VETNAPQIIALLSTGPNPSPGALESTFEPAHAADITLELFDSALTEALATVAIAGLLA